MKERERYRPFTNDPGNRLRFTDAPLALVVYQVRWSQLSALQGDIEPIGLELGRKFQDYPLYSPELENSFDFTRDGRIQARSVNSFKWEKSDHSTAIAFGPDSLTLFTKSYDTFGAFSEEFREVIEALEETVMIPFTTRVGVRYVNLISNRQHIERLDEIIKPELLGHQNLQFTGEDAQMLQAISQSWYKVGKGYLTARSGIVSPGETVDPALEPLTDRSWVLDIDSYDQNEGVFAVDYILETIGRLSDAAYDFFKFVIKEDFIGEFGGERN